MGSEPTTTLTVAKLKALCVLNDLSASGKKADLLARLLEAGVDKETLGIEVFDESTSTFQPAIEEEPSDEPVMMSLEDDEPVEPVPLPSSSEDEIGDEDVLEAEILEADLIDAESDDEPSAEASVVPLPVEKSAATPPAKTEDAGAVTLMEMVRRPQTIAVMLTLLLLGAGGWYYVNNQLEPFTADSLRYGDSMGSVSYTHLTLPTILRV